VSIEDSQPILAGLEKSPIRSGPRRGRDAQSSAMENDITRDTVTAGAHRMGRDRRRREAGQQCITLTLHEYQVWALVARGFLAKDQRQNREAVADALRAYLTEWAMPPIE